MTGEWIAEHSSRFMRFMGFMKVHEVRFRVRRMQASDPMNLMNPMNRLVLVVSFLLPLAQAGPTSVSYPAKAGPGAGKRVVFLAGDEEYRSEEALPMLAKILSQRHGFKCTVLFSVGPDGTIDPKAVGVAVRRRRARSGRRDRHAAALPQLARRRHGAVRRAAATPASRSSRSGRARTPSTGSRRTADGSRGTTTTTAGSESACSARPGSRTGAGTRSRRRAG